MQEERITLIRKMKKIKIFFSILILFICFSCNRGETYFHFNDIPDAKWSKRDTLFFQIDSTLIQPNTLYDISIESVNNTEYLYQNLWLYISADIIGSEFKVEQREYMLADSLGRWYGAGFGSNFQLSLPLKTQISFPQKRNYTIKIVHGMIDEPLVGIEKIGLKVQQIKLTNIKKNEVITDRR